MTLGENSVHVPREVSSAVGWSLVSPSSDADTDLLLVAVGQGVGLHGQLGQYSVEPRQVELELLLQVLFLLILLLGRR